MALLIGVEMWTDRAGLFVPPAQPETPVPVRLIPYPPDYATAIKNMDRALVTARERAELRAGDWLAHELLARARFDRARLTGSYDDYAAAEQALQRSFALAPAGTGPHMLQAAFDFAMHRLASAEAHLAQVEKEAVRASPSDRAEMEAMRGDIAFYRGGYQEALRRYDRADRLSAGATDFRRAVYHAFTGDPARALTYIDRAERSGARPTNQLSAWLELQRGIVELDRGRVRKAAAHFQKADSIFPGYWLIEEHIAETLALSGQLGEAERRYRDIVARTGAPEFMDALAVVARQRGDHDEARQWTRRAAAIWQRRLNAFPEATYGHAIDHCLVAGKPACALNLARSNHAARPYGEAKAILAEAMLRSGRAAEAREILDGLSASPWRSARMSLLAEELVRHEF